jgi:hypothetical protein
LWNGIFWGSVAKRSATWRDGLGTREALGHV